MEMFMRASGWEIRHTALVSIHTLMGLSMLASGVKINSTVKARRHGQTEQAMKEIMCLGRSKAMATSTGLMDLTIPASLLTTILKALENTVGLMVEGTTVNGGITKCMGKESLHGLMVVDMREST
jgi:hypothetical protein